MYFQSCFEQDKCNKGTDHQKLCLNYEWKIKEQETLTYYET